MCTLTMITYITSSLQSSTPTHFEHLRFLCVHSYAYHISQLFIFPWVDAAFHPRYPCQWALLYHTMASIPASNPEISAFIRYTRGDGSLMLSLSVCTIILTNSSLVSKWCFDINQLPRPAVKPDVFMSDHHTTSWPTQSLDIPAGHYVILSTVKLLMHGCPVLALH